MRPGSVRHPSADARAHRGRSGGGARARRRHRRRRRRRQHLPRRAGVGKRHVAADRRHHGHAGDGHERAGAGDGASSARASARAPCRRSPCRRSARPTSASARCAISRTDRIIVLRRRHRQSVILPPTPRRCCAPPRWRCDAVLKATDVDGVYSADPKKDQTAKRYDRLDPSGGARSQSEGHGCDGLRACPGKPYAYHRLLDPRAGGDRDGLARHGGRPSSVHEPVHGARRRMRGIWRHATGSP